MRTVLMTVTKAAVAGMMTIIVASSIGRYILNSPIPNTIDLVELVFLPVIIWGFMIETQYRRDQISMDFLRGNRLKDIHSKIVDIVFHVFVVGLLLLAAQDLFTSTLDLYADDVWTRGEIQIPTFGVRAIIAVGVTLLAAVITAQVLQWTKSLYSGYRAVDQKDGLAQQESQSGK